MAYFGPGGQELRLDYDGIGKILRSGEMAGVMAEAANNLAAELMSRGVERVWVDTYTTDRRAAAVTIPDYNLEGVEAKAGLLSDAALSVDLEVKLG